MARILVIDDDPQIRTVLKKSLRSDGHQVMEACNGDVGMKLMGEGPFEVVITDIVMPHKEGFETISELRRNYPDTKIIAMSGGGLSIEACDVLPTAVILGAHSTLLKPFVPKQLLEAVENVFDQ